MSSVSLKVTNIISIFLLTSNKKFVKTDKQLNFPYVFVLLLTLWFLSYLNCISFNTRHVIYILKV